MVRLATPVLLAALASMGCSLLAPSDDELGGGRSDAGGSGAQDAGLVPTCSGAQVDNFDSASLGGFWNVYTQGNATVQPSTSGLRIEASDDGSSAYIASQMFSFRDCAVTLHVLEFPNTAALSYMFWNLQDPGGTLPQIYAQQGTGHAQQVDGGDDAFPYSDGQELWLRLRESQGTLYYDTSPDGSDWTSFASEPTPVSDTVSTAIGAGTIPGNDQNPGAAVIAGFNSAP